MQDDLVSIIIPAKDEALNLPTLLDEIGVAMAGRRFEVIVVDDGSTDDTPALLARERDTRHFPVRHVCHPKSSGQSLAIRSAAWVAEGAIAATLDADGQNDPKYLPVLIDALIEAGPTVGLAVGQRLKRTDSGAKRLASRFANRLRDAMLKDGVRDSGCGLKAIRTEVLRKVPFFDGTHRFMAALVIQERYGIVHRDVVDRPRRHGTSHYGIFDRGARGALDLIGVWWLARRRRKMPIPTEIVRG